MKARYRPLDVDERPATPPPESEGPPTPTPPPVRPPLSPPGSSRDRREDRVRRFWAERDAAETRARDGPGAP